MTAAAPPPGASDLTTGRLSAAILRVAVPAVGAALLQLVFLLIDTFWVGRILGPAALAAVSTAGFAVWMLIALGEMIGVGLTAVAARRHGEGAHGIAAVAAGTTLALGLLGGVAVAIAGWMGLPWLFANALVREAERDGSLREEALRIVAGLAEQYPENPVFRRFLSGPGPGL